MLSQVVNYVRILRCRYDMDGDGKLSLREVWAATQGNADYLDAFGWIAAKLEWGTTW